jgi:hypothetical protein
MKLFMMKPSFINAIFTECMKTLSKPRRGAEEPEAAARLRAMATFRDRVRFSAG